MCISPNIFPLKPQSFNFFNTTPSLLYYFIDLSLLNVSLYTPFCSDKELSCAYAMSDIFKRNQYIFSRSLLRLILSKFFKRPPLSFNILLSKDGKPFLDSRLLFFNISHSDSYLGILFSNASEVGLDLQKFRPITNLSSLIRRFFHPLEIDFLLSSPDMEGEFFRLWTLKEAYVKCLGHGISYGFHNFHCLNDQVTDPKMDTVFYLSYFCLSNLHIGFSTSVSHLFLYQDSPPLL